MESVNFNYAEGTAAFNSDLQLSPNYKGWFAIKPISKRCVDWMQASEYVSGDLITPIELNDVLKSLNDWNPENWKPKKKAKLPKKWPNYENRSRSDIPLKEAPPAPPLRITQDNFQDKSLAKQKWSFSLASRKNHRAFYGRNLSCKIGTGCMNEPFYQVKWYSYNKTGKAGYAYGSKHNHKWACIECADKWTDRNIRKKDPEFNLPTLPCYLNPSWKCIQWNGAPTVYDSHFC